MRIVLTRKPRGTYCLGSSRHDKITARNQTLNEKKRNAQQETNGRDQNNQRGKKINTRSDKIQEPPTTALETKWYICDPHQSRKNNGAGYALVGKLPSTTCSCLLVNGILDDHPEFVLCLRFPIALQLPIPIAEITRLRASDSYPFHYFRSL